jgi:PIN domain nuclease of toxin-antitoxin system
MRLLLDSHALIWAADDPPKIPATALGLIQDPLNERLISAGTVWEIAIKYGKGRLPLSMPYRRWMEQAIADLCLTILPITVEHSERQTTLPPHHGDPFDRLLASQALVEGIPLLSGDVLFDAYGVKRVWD